MWISVDQCGSMWTKWDQCGRNGINVDEMGSMWMKNQTLILNLVTFEQKAGVFS